MILAALSGVRGFQLDSWGRKKLVSPREKEFKDSSEKVRRLRRLTQIKRWSLAEARRHGVYKKNDVDALVENTKRNDTEVVPYESWI